MAAELNCSCTASTGACRPHPGCGGRWGLVGSGLSGLLYVQEAGIDVNGRSAYQLRRSFGAEEAQEKPPATSGTVDKAGDQVDYIRGHVTGLGDGTISSGRILTPQSSGFWVILNVSRRSLVCLSSG